MKLNIENKILIPFVFLFFLSLSILMATSFRNDYKLIIDNQFRYMDSRMIELEGRLNYGIFGLGKEEKTADEILEELRISNVMKIIILKDSEVILNTTQLPINTKTLTWKEEYNEVRHLNEENFLITYKYYKPFSWTLVIIEDKEQLLSFFYESYKYTILTGIIFITLSMQLTILIAANITKPIHKLVRFCAVVSSGNYGERIALKRQDEIGQLGLAFNHMLDELDRSMHELLEMKNYNQDILNNLEKGIITYSFDEGLRSSNPCAQTLIDGLDGYHFNEKNVEELIEQMISETKRTSMSQYELYRLVDSNGRDKIIDCSTSIMWGEDESVRGYICSFNDVTERKKLESRIQRLSRLATAGRLASGMAHEIRNPLAGMRTSIQVLNKRLKNELTGSNELLFERLISEIDRIDKLISQLLDYSKRKPHLPQEVDVEKVIDHILSLLNDAFEERGIEVVNKINTNHRLVYADPGHIHQILLNIIKNAMEAVDSNNGHILIENIYNHGTVKSFELRIIDNGIGIPQNAIEQVFDPFYTSKNEGTGLGLSVVHELVEQNQGDIDINSIFNEGTTVTLRFKEKETDNV